LEGASGEKNNGQGHKVAVVEADGDAAEAIDISDLVMDVPEPEPGPVTVEVVEILRSDPELAEVAEIAEEYA
jgi:hypothetical protein